MKKFLLLLRSNFLLILILILFFSTRLFRITEIPASVYWDEASIGYNAYSVLMTGKDEWGETLPLHFRAFGEFKLPVYVYSVLVTESVLGLTPLAVRLPAVLYGLFSVLGLYFLILEITNKRTIALLSSFLFSITPWFFIFSRTGYEATAGLAFFIWGIFLFLKYKDSGFKILFSVFLFLISAYSYNSFRILVPLVLIPIFISMLKNKNIKVFILSGAILIIGTLPIYKLYSKDSGLGRLQAVGDIKNIPSNYFKNFSAVFLFNSGDTNPRSQLPGQSQLYLLDAVFLLLGIVFIYKKKSFNILLPLIGLIIAPIPASLTRENPHALRSILLSPVFASISAMGIYYLMEKFNKWKRYILISVVVLYALAFENYFYKFGNDYNKLSASDWQYGYKELLIKHEGELDKYNKIYISDKLAQPYIFPLFYYQIDPGEFKQTKKLNNVSDWGFSTVNSFGKFNFIKGCKADFEKGSLVLCP